MANEIYDKSWWGLPEEGGWGGAYYNIASSSDIFFDRKDSLRFAPASSVASGQINANRPLDQNFTFTRASTATFLGSDGLLQTAASGVPRIDYLDNTNGHILLEPAATNVLPDSNAFNTSWSTSGVTLTQDDYISPSGSTDAWLLTTGTGSGRSRIRKDGITPPNPCTASIFAKKGNSHRLFLSVGGTKSINALYDLENGVVLDTSSAGGAGAITSTTIEDYGNGWYRCSMTGEPNLPSNSLAFGAYYKDTITGTISTNWERSGETIYVYGAQLESTEYLTSYIATSGASATRVAETAADAGNSTLFNDSEGVLFIEMATLDNSTVEQISISDGSTSNRVYFTKTGTANQLRFSVVSGGSTQASITTTVTDNTVMNKIAGKFKANDVAFWVNGTEVGTDTSATMPTGLDELACDSGAGSLNFYGKIKQIKVYKEALTDAQLQNLTS